MTSSLPTPPTARNESPDKTPEPDKPRHRRWTPALLRKLGTAAPLAAAYAVFQAVLSSLPPGLSDTNLHYMLSIASGATAGSLIGCAMLWARRPQQGSIIPRPRRESPKADIPVMFSMCYQTLLSTVVTFDDERLATLTGWPHFFDEAQAGDRPTAYGTAYGLKLAITLGNQDGRLDRAALADTLWKLRRPDGGWASRTQGDIGRPEVTAVVLGSLAAVGYDSERLDKGLNALENMLRPGVDPTATRSTYIVATLIREFVRIDPDSSHIDELRRILLAGAVQDPRSENLSCWSARLDVGGGQRPIPSAVHTSLAVVALARACLACGDDARSHSALEQAVEWLVLNPNMANQIEQIRRPITADHWESLTARHFSAAWTVKALIAAREAGISGAGSLLDAAATVVLTAQRDGIWQQDEGARPVWMTYQGISALHSYVLSQWSVT